MALDLSGDWVIFDNNQSITYYSRLSDGTFGAGVGVTALKREDHKKAESINSVEFPFHICIWEIWATTFGSPVVCKRGDKFTAATVTGVQTWIVERVDYSDFVTRYRLGCYQEGMNS